MTRRATTPIPKGSQSAANIGSAARPRKRFGQHFLTDQAVLERIFAVLALRPSDRVLEIGPGRGALTARLCAEAAQVTAVEIDRDLAAGLQAHLPQLHLVRDDVLRTDLRAIATAPGGPFRIVGNLPYNIASPLLERLFEIADHVADIHVMLQAEVAARLAARPGGKTYGRLSVVAQHHCDVAPLFNVSPASFTPRPKVESSFVRLVPRQREPCDLDMLRRVLRAAFGQRRKTLANALESVVRDWRPLAIDPRRRAETLSVSEYVAIANHCAGGDDAEHRSPR